MYSAQRLINNKAVRAVDSRSEDEESRSVLDSSKNRTAALTTPPKAVVCIASARSFSPMKSRVFGGYAGHIAHPKYRKVLPFTGHPGKRPNMKTKSPGPMRGSWITDSVTKIPDGTNRVSREWKAGSLTSPGKGQQCQGT